MTRRQVLAAGPLLAAKRLAWSQEPAIEPGEKPVEFICPMDPDVRSPRPARCPRCGMKLVAGIPDFLEYRVELQSTPRLVRAGIPATLQFRVLEPAAPTPAHTRPSVARPVRDFEVIHEKLFHLFILSEDLRVFAHEHPVKDFGPEFELTWTFPQPGLYRLMCDYYPRSGTPQITVKTLIVGPGPGNPIAALESNTQVKLALEPDRPVAGMRTRLYFHLEPAAGWKPWLGAWGHLLVASADTVDLIHAHPFLVTPGERMQFNVIFPRPGKHRVWVQFDRNDLVNSAAFDVDVVSL